MNAKKIKILVEILWDFYISFIAIFIELEVILHNRIDLRVELHTIFHVDTVGAFRVSE